MPESKEETAPKTVIGYKTHDGKGQTIDADEELDSRKKVMVGSVKVTGYRVQVFAGGNSRADRQKAQRIGNEIKGISPSILFMFISIPPGGYAGWEISAHWMRLTPY